VIAELRPISHLGVFGPIGVLMASLFTLASMNNLFYFGLLTVFTIIAAFLADLILAPALMALVIRPRGVELAAALEMEASR
jgi:predicted RND superfamily exporter protein